jgi:vitamin B12 transporter
MILLTAAALAALAAPAQADPATEQPLIVVTADRRARTVDDTLARVSVLTRADIEASQALDLVDLLRRVPGVDLGRTGGPGQSTSLFLRGSNSNHVLVLIDGIRVSSANSGLFDFAHLPLQQIERIEIVRGPRASVWGSEAIGGVIQIFTRSPDGAGATARAGRHALYDGNVRYGWRGEHGAFAATLGGTRFDGYSAQNESGFSFDPDDDGYINRNLSVRGALDLGSQRVSGSFLGTRADVEFDQGLTDARNHSLGVAVAGPLAAGWDHTLTLGSAREDLTTPAFFARFRSRRETADWVHDVDLGAAGALVGGLNYVHEDGASIDTFGDAAVYARTRSNRAAFLGWQRDLAALDLQLSGRHDDNSAFGSETTFQGALGWSWSEQGRAFVSYGEGFRAPNLNELYSPGFGGLFAGNPDLAPESSESVELGLTQSFGAHRLEASAYRTRIRNLVSFSGGETFRAENIGRADIDGLEIGYAWQGERYGVDASATLQDADNAATGQPLLRRPDRKLALAVSRRYGDAFEAALEGSYSSERADFGAELPSYALLDARIAWRATPQLKVGLRLDNAFDRDYELAAGFNTPGRSWLLTIDYAAGD